MGASQSQSFTDELSGYKIIKKVPQQNITYLSHNETDKEYLLRQLTFNDENIYKKSFEEHKKRQTIVDDHLTHLGRVEGKQIDHLCSNLYKIIAIWEYPYRFISDEICERSFQKRKFEEKQLWSILASSILGMSTLQKNKIKHDALRSRNILLDNEGLVKIADPLATGAETNLDIVYNNRQAESIYLSPELCESLQSRGAYSNSYKNDVWAMGMILLECGLLQSQTECYRDEYQRIDYERINKNLNRFGRQYGEELKVITDLMLKRESKDRPDWIDLEQYARKSSEKSEVQVLPSQRKQSSFSPIYKFDPSLSSNNPSNQLNSRPVTVSQYQPYKMQYPALHYNQGQTHVKPTNMNPPFIPNNGNLQPRYRTADNKSNVYSYQSKPLTFTANFPPVQNSGFQPWSRQMPNNGQLLSYQKKQLATPLISNSNPSPVKYTPSYLSFQTYIPPTSSYQALSPAFTSYNNAFISNPSSLASTYETKFNYNSSLPQYTGSPSTFNSNAQSIYHPPTSYSTNGELFSMPLQNQSKPNQHSQKSDKKFEKPEGSFSSSFQQPIQRPADKSVQKSANEEAEFVIETFKQGSRYEGYKLKDMRHGEGKFFYQDGGMYDGHWVMNKMEGYGSLYYQSGKLAYEGMWKNDQFQGRGKLYNEYPFQTDSTFDYTNFDEIDEFWEYYDGDFSEDFKKGEGKLMLSNGQYFEGRFDNDMVEGPGKFHCHDGKVIQGVWKSNQLISS